MSYRPNHPIRLISTIDYDTMGPAMRRLAPKERAFVYAFVECGGKNVDAARAAGYGEGSRSPEAAEAACRSAGSRLIRSDKVLEAMAEEAKRRLRSGALLAADALLKLVQNNSLAPRDMKAVTSELLDRAGLIVEQKVEVMHKTEREQDVIREITELARGLGLDARSLLGQSRIVEAEFDVVPGSSAGLEDIL